MRAWVRGNEWNHIHIGPFPMRADGNYEDERFVGGDCVEGWR